MVKVDVPYGSEPLSTFVSTNGGIMPYMTNKIRILLNSIQQKNGYPVRIHHTVAFFDLLMFSIPFYTKLLVWDTMQCWDGLGLNVAYAQRYIYDANRASYFLPEVWKWRKVLIYTIPNEYVQNTLSLIPFDIDNALIDLAMKTTVQEWPIFENLVSFGGLNDVVIAANWDKIKEVLNANGY